MHPIGIVSTYLGAHAIPQGRLFSPFSPDTLIFVFIFVVLSVTFSV